MPVERYWDPIAIRSPVSFHFQSSQCLADRITRVHTVTVMRAFSFKRLPLYRMACAMASMCFLAV